MRNMSQAIKVKVLPDTMPGRLPLPEQGLNMPELFWDQQLLLWKHTAEHRAVNMVWWNWLPDMGTDQCRRYQLLTSGKSWEGETVRFWADPCRRKWKNGWRKKNRSCCFWTAEAMQALYPAVPVVLWWNVHTVMYHCQSIIMADCCAITVDMRPESRRYVLSVALLILVALRPAPSRLRRL